MKSIKTVPSDDSDIGQALWEAAQIGFWSAVLSVAEFGALIAEFVHRGKQEAN